MQLYLFKSPGTIYHPQHVSSLKAAVDKLAEDSLDVVLVDLELPDSSGVDTLVAIRKATEAATVVVTCAEEQLLHALAAAADEFLYKGDGTIQNVSRAVSHATVRRALLLRRGA